MTVQSYNYIASCIGFEEISFPKASVGYRFLKVGISFVALDRFFLETAGQEQNQCGPQTMFLDLYSRI